MSFLALRSRRCIVEISRVIDRYRICRFFPSYSSQCPVDRLCVIGRSSSRASVGLSQDSFDRDCASQVVTDLIESINAGHHALLGLLYLSASFDTVDHDVLIERGSRRVRCWGRCYSCSTRQTLVSWLPVSACHLISTPTTRNSVCGITLHLMDCCGAGWTWELSGSRSGCDLIDSVLISRRRSFFGARPADGVAILTPGSSVSTAP